LKGVAWLAKVAQTALEEQLSKSGALPFLEIGESSQAALITSQWLLKEASPKERKFDGDMTANLYDMLSYLMYKGSELGFSYETRVVKGDKVAFAITNNFNIAD
jgi:hypothetical protein